MPPKKHTMPLAMRRAIERWNTNTNGLAYMRDAYAHMAAARRSQANALGTGRQTHKERASLMEDASRLQMLSNIMGSVHIRALAMLGRNSKNSTNTDKQRKKNRA